MLENQRYSNFISQLLPLAGLKMGCSVDSFVRLYSISFILIYYGLFLLITHVYKSFEGGLILMLSLCMGLRHLFYIPVAELQQAMAFTVLLWVHVSRPEFYSARPGIRILLLPASYVVICSYFHPLSVLLILFSFCMVMIVQRNYKDKKIWSLTAFALLVFCLKMITISGNGYEAGRIAGLKSFILAAQELAKLPSTIYLEALFTTQMKTFILAIVLVFGACLYFGKIRLFILYAASTFGFIYLIIVAMGNGETPEYYENYLIAPGFFTAMVFAGIFSEQWKRTTVLLAAVPFLFFSMQSIAQSHSIFTKKMEYISRLVNYGRKFEQKKYILNEANLPMLYTWVSWTLPFETFLYSDLHSTDSAVTFFATERVNRYDSLLTDSSVFLGPEWDVYMFNYSANKLNKKYFRLPSLGYKKLNTSQTDSLFHENIFSPENIRVSSIEQSVTSEHDTFVVVPVTIKNSSGEVLRSVRDGDHSVSLSYHLYDAAGNQLVWDGYRTRLDVDIENEFTQGVIVIIPRQPGDYKLVIDFVTEERRWWNINEGVKLIVK